ncbi:MAG: diaminopimelate decarboxylase [Spirochaetia bacterium]|nr:diaminopimelate decarboxylase [Spirochaetia bacterium]
MSEKKLPLSPDEMAKLAYSKETPFHLYDEKGIRENARAFNKAFSWIHEFKNYYAVKACPNPAILQIMKEEGFGADCSSYPELLLAQKVGITGEDIMFTSNDTPSSEFIAAKKMNAVINLDDITHIETLYKSAGMPELISFRYNPGPERTGNAIIGNPIEAKYGVRTDQLVECYVKAKALGATRFALHTMVASNELDGSYIVETARMLFTQALRIYEETGIIIEFVNLGGGIGIPYRPSEQAMDFDMVSSGIKNIYEEMIKGTALDPLRIVFECGRMASGPFGYLVSKVLHVTSKYKEYVGLDASMANLMRPALYGSYHHITVVNKEDEEADHLYDVTGSLCENNDKFAIDRALPEVEIGDVVVIHDTGAHGHSMGFNYNSKLRSAEYLLKEDKSVQLIRRAETIDDLFATLNY